MAQTVDEALQAAQLYSDGEEYRLIRLPAPAIMAAAAVIAEIGEPFAALVIDKDEVTLILPADTLADFARRLPGHTVSAAAYRLITLDVELEPELTGFMARIAQTLAEADIPIVALGAFTRDHLLVPSAHFDAAMTALQRLTSG
jgi:hypothetical protein